MKKVKDEDKDQGGHVADQFHIGAAYHSFEQARTNPEEAHHQAEDNGEEGSPETQAQGGEHSLQEKIGNVSVSFLVIADDVL